MSRLRLELRAPPRGRVDMAGVTPERLHGLDRAAIAAIEVRAGRERLPLGELFALSGDDPGEIALAGATGGLDRVGAGMRSGRIVVEGDAGDCLAQDMHGGEIEVRGSAGAYAASGLYGGRVRIGGDAGDFLGAAVAGERHGMRGGSVVVRGRAGDRAGERQRRGIIVIGGDAGDYLGARMLAGTVVVLGRAGRHAGFGMRRGTLLLAQPPASLPATFNESGVHDLGFLVPLVRDLRGLDEACARLDASRTRVLRFVGDRGCDGRGEVLVWR